MYTLYGVYEELPEESFVRSDIKGGMDRLIPGGRNMITVNLYYKGQNGSARAFAEDMEKSGIADSIRAEEGNLRYQYFMPLDDPETVLLIDSWADQAAIDAHHASPMMKQLAELREKYDLHMTVERFISDEYEADQKFIRK